MVFADAGCIICFSPPSMQQFVAVALSSCSWWPSFFLKQLRLVYNRKVISYSLMQIIGLNTGKNNITFSTKKQSRAASYIIRLA